VLPQLAGPPFITDGGMETTLIFHEGLDLPDFAAFVLLEDEQGRDALRAYFRPYTVETDGRLPSGEGLREAVEAVDEQTGGAVAYFMINCAHPTHFAHVLDDAGPWLDRIHGVRANASTKSHAELDEAEELDEGDPVDLAARYRELRERMPNLNVVGGCCGTDHRHIAEICAVVAA
jgi:S-methylmethionine-dependent homocysteine/selenocysteine methylase